MLLHDDVVTDGEPKPRSLSSWLSRKERVEHLVLHLWWNAGAVVPDADFHAVAKAFGRCGKRWRVIPAIGIRLAFRCGIKPVNDQVQQRPGDVLRKDIGLAGRWVERALQSDVESLLLS